MPITYLDEEEEDFASPLRPTPLTQPKRRKITYFDEEPVSAPTRIFQPFQAQAPKKELLPPVEEMFKPKPKEVGTFEGIANAARNAFASSQQALAVTGGVTPEEAKEISKIEFEKNARQVSPDYKEYQEAQGFDAVKAFARNPFEVTTNIVAEGLAGSLPALGAGLAAGGVGAAVAAPTVVGAPVGFLAGQVAGTFAGSLATEYGSKVLEELQGAGMDINNPDSITDFFSRQELVDAAKDKALKRGVPIAAFDALSAGIGGKVGAITKAAFKTKPREAVAEMAVQAALGGGGEVVGSLAAGDKIDPKAVFAEVVGEVGPGAAEIGVGKIQQTFAERRKQEQIKRAAKVSQDLENNNAPLTADALKATVAKNAVEEEKATIEETDTALAEEAAKFAPPEDAITKQELKTQYSALSPEDLTDTEATFRERLDDEDPEMRTFAQNALDAIAEVRAEQVTPAPPVTPPVEAGVAPAPVAVEPSAAPVTPAAPERTIAEAIRDKDTFVFEGRRGAVSVEDGATVFRPFGTTEKFEVPINPNQTIGEIEGIEWVRKGQTRAVPAEPTQPEKAAIIESKPVITQEEIDATEDDFEIPQALVEIERSPTLNAISDIFDTGESKIVKEGKRATKVSQTPEFYRQISPEQIETANRQIDNALRVIDGMAIPEEQKQALAEPYLLLDQDITNYESNPEYQRYKSSIRREVRPAGEAIAFPETITEVEAGVRELEQRARTTAPAAEVETAASLSRVADNTATDEEVVRLARQGLVNIQEGQNVITPRGEEVMQRGGAPLPRLTPEERAAEVAAAPTPAAIVEQAPLVAEAPAVTPVPVAETPAVAPAPEVVAPLEVTAVPASEAGYKGPMARGKWAVIGGPMADTPEAAVEEFNKLEARNLEVAQQKSDFESVKEKLRLGTWQEADIKKATRYGKTSAPRGEVEGILNQLGLKKSEAKQVVDSVPQIYESARGTTYYEVGNVIERARSRGLLPAKVAPEQRPSAKTEAGIRDLEAIRTAATTPVTTPPVTEAVTPAAAPTPAGISVGNRVKTKTTPQSFVVEEVLPQSEREAELGEQYYRIKNERTGEMQTVEANDIRVVRGKGVRRMAAQAEGQAIVDADMGRRSQAELTPQEIDQLEKGKKIRVFRAMQIIDGKLYPPMSALVGGKLRKPTEIGTWEKAEERPDLLDKKGKFILQKGNKTTVPAAYNPYFHTSSSPLNDQFSSAYKRDNLVTVEVEIPASELTSGYKAEGAKDAVGEVSWNAGPVSSKLPEGKKRRVFLSRYAKVVRIVPDSEVAGIISNLLQGTNLSIPENTVTPSLKSELEKKGVSVTPRPTDIRRMAEELRAEEKYTPVPEADRYTFREASGRAIRFFGGEKPENFVIVNDSTDPDYEFKAGYDPETGEIILNRAYIQRGENIEDILTHELGHYIYSDPQFQADFQDFLESMPDEARAEIDRIVNEGYNKETNEVQIEEREVMAFTSLIRRTKRGLTAWEKLKDTIKKIINRFLGTNITLSDQGAMAVFNVGYKRFKSGERIIREMKEGTLRTAPEGMTQMDRDYLAAVERGDMETAQRMVDEAASRSMDNPIVAYHGTTSPTEFTEFKLSERPVPYVWNDPIGMIEREGFASPLNQYLAVLIKPKGDQFVVATLGKNKAHGKKFMDLQSAIDAIEKGRPDKTISDRPAFFFATNRLYAELFAGHSGNGITAKESGKSRVINVFIGRKKIFDFRDKQTREWLQNWISKNKDYIKSQSRLWDFEFSKNAAISNLKSGHWGIFEALPKIIDDLKAEGYTGYTTFEGGVLRWEGQTDKDYFDRARKNYGRGGLDASLNYAIFNPNQIKSADPVTYDDAGNVIPLSQRFRPTSPDIRRMAPEPAPTPEAVVEEAPAERPKRRTKMQNIIDISTGVKRPKTKLTVNEMTALKDQIRMGARKRREDKRTQREFAKDLTQQLRDAAIRGKVRPSQLRAITSKALQTQFDNEASILGFVNYANKVIENANYEKDLSDAKSAIKSAKRLAKQKGLAANIKANLEKLANIDPRQIEPEVMVEVEGETPISVAEFTAVLKEYMKAGGPVTAEEYVLVPDAEITDFLTKLGEQIETNRKATENLGMDGELAAIADKTPEEIDAELARDEERRNRIEQKINGLAEEAQVALVNYDNPEITSEEKIVLDDMKRITLSDISIGERKEFIKIANNILVNNKFLGAQKFASMARGQIGAVEAAKDSKTVNRNSATLKVYENLLGENFGRLVNLGTQSFADTFRNLTGTQGLPRLLYQMGFGEIERGQANTNRARREITDGVQQRFKQIEKETGQRIAETQGVYSMGVAGNLIQIHPDETEAEGIQRMRGLIEKDIEKKKKSPKTEDRKTALYVEKALDEVYADSIQGILDNLNRLHPANYKALTFLMNEVLPEYKPLLKEHDELFNNQTENYENPYYLPIRYRSIGTEPKKPGELRGRASDSVTAPKQAPNSIKRIKNSVLPEGKQFDYNLTRNVLDSLSTQLEAAYTNPGWQQVYAFLKSPEAVEALGGVENYDFVTKRINNLSDSRERRIYQMDPFNQAADFVANMVRKIGTSIALGGIGQAAKQMPDQVATTIANVNDLSITTPAFTEIKAALPAMRQFSIGERGEIAGGSKWVNQLEGNFTKLQQFMQDGLWPKAMEAFENLNNFWLIPLKVSDTVAASHGWISYYKKYLKDNDIQFTNWDNESDLIAKGDRSRVEAGLYADQMIDIYQGSSDPTKMATFAQRGDSGGGNLLKTMIMPFSSFVIQQRSRILSDLRDISYGDTDEKKVAAKGLAGTLLGIVIFHGVRRYALPFLTGGVAAAAYGLLGVDMEEPDEEERLEKERRVFRQFLGEVASNIFVGGYSAYAETRLIDAVNAAAYFYEIQTQSENVLDDKGEVMSWEKYRKERAPMYRYTGPGADSTLGMLDILPSQARESFDRLKDLSDDEIMDSLTEEEQRVLILAALSETLYTMRLNDADVARMVKRMAKDVKDQTEARQKAERQLQRIYGQ